MSMMQEYPVRVLCPFLAAWLFALLLGRPMIPFLHRLKFDQTEREEGLESHKKKTGTPTMGGIIFIIPAAAVALVYAVVSAASSDTAEATALVAVLIPTIGFGVVGFADDYLKVIRHHNLGLKVWQKFALEFVVTAVFFFYISFATDISLSEMIIPFSGGRVLNLGVLAVPALIFITLATTNGTNLTDGVDALCASVTIPVALFFVISAMMTAKPAAPAAAAMAGALLGYLFYNYHPAKVFMGDTGSLAIGGFVIGMSYALGMPLFIPVVGLIYAAEVVSVILQVSYFKATKGKRIFRMAPLHHHYEKGGWSEAKVTGVFTAVTLIMCLAALAGIGL